MCHKVHPEYESNFPPNDAYCATVGPLPGAFVQHASWPEFRSTGEYDWECTGSANPSDDPTAADGVEWLSDEYNLRCAAEYGLLVIDSKPD